MNAPAASSAARIERHGILPADGFAWRLIIVLGLHAGGLYLVVSSIQQQPVSIVLGGEPGGGGGGAVVDSVPLNEVNWVDASVVDPVVALPKPALMALDEPESDLPLPRATDPPKPEPKLEPLPEPEPPKEVVLKPVPKPEPPKEVVLKPVPKPEPAPPKTVALKPVPKPVSPPQPPKPKPVALKPAPAPAPKPQVVASKTPVLTPAPAPAPVSAPAPAPVPVRATPVPAPVVASPLPGARSGTMGTGTSASGAGGSGGFGSGPGGNGGPMSDISAFHLSVKDAYFSQWQQPHGLVESGSKFRVRVEIVIGRAGNVISARIVARSGNADMDRSVQEAVSRVSQVEPLPTGIGGAVYTVLLNFDI